MKRKNTTRNALFTSIISLLLCVSMLVGTTFAWFTDSVTSGINTIAAGNLDVELYHGKDKSPVDQVKEDTLLFTDVGGNVIDQWEPGVVAYTNLKVANVGTLALKYQLSINSTETNYVQYADGSIYTLADALKVAVVKDGVSGDRAAVVAAGVASGWEGLKSFTLSGELNSKEESDTYGIVIYWEPGENDNIFNMNNGKVTSDGEALTITLGVNLFATQEMYEDDSFGNDYDKLAPWAGKADTEWYNETATELTIASAEELAGLAEIVNSGKDTFSGKTVKLAANIDLNDAPWTPIGNNSNGWNNKFDGTFIGTGYTISNLYVTGTSGLGLFGYVGDSAHIEGVTIDGAYVSGTDYVGAVLGSGYLAKDCLKYCTVKNAEIIAMPYLKADGVTYDGGAKAGAVAGYAINGDVTGNKAINCTVTAYRDLGGIVGMVSGEDRAVTVSGNIVENVTLVYLNMNGAAMHEGKVNEYMGDIVGRVKNVSNNATIATDNTATNVTRTTDITYMIDGVWYRKNVDANTVTLFAVTDAAPEVLNIPAGVTHLGYKVLEGNTTVKEVVIPASVIDFGGVANANGQGASGGFFYLSAVEKVTLPESLTAIPDGAFNQATKLKEINIPASVTSIGIGAFRGTALTELTISATVTSIGYGAFRDMDQLTTATIEGDVYIPGYAFRDCSALKTVYLKGQNVTFGPDMIFTVSSTNNENPNGITVYVANDAVKESLEATKQFKGTIVVTAFVSDADELATAFEAGKTEIVLAAGNFTIPSAVAGKTVTITGSGDATVFDFTKAYNVGGATITFKNLKIQGKNENVMSGFGIQHTTSNIVYENCTFDGAVTNEFYGTVAYKNCTFTGTGYITTYSVKSATFENCVFDKADSRALLVYSHGDNPCVVTVSGCTFKAAAKGYTGAGDWTAAVEVNTENIPTAGTTVTISGCEYDSNYSNIVRDKSPANTTETYAVITVDGAVLVTPTNVSALTIASNTKYMLSGDFSSANVSLKMAEGVENVVFDGSNATNINELIIVQNGKLIDHADDHVGERSGKVTVQNFNVLSQIDVFACKTEVEVCNNTAEALMVHAGNCALKIHDNVIDGNFEQHPTYSSATTTWNNNQYGITLNIYDYDLWFDNNVVTDAYSHAVGINGWQGTYNTDDQNVIKSFTGNKITVNSTEKTERAALKIFDDETYANRDDDHGVVNATAQTLINTILAGGNTFTLEEGKDHVIFEFYDARTNS